MNCGTVSKRMYLTLFTSSLMRGTVSHTIVKGTETCDKLVCVFSEAIGLWLVGLLFERLSGSFYLKSLAVQVVTSCLCWLLNSNLQGAHCEERLRIEIVNLREQLDTRREENGLWIILVIFRAGFQHWLLWHWHLFCSLYFPACPYLQLLSSEVLEGECFIISLVSQLIGLLIQFFQI